MNSIEKSLQEVIDKTVNKGKVFGISFAINRDDSTWNIASGNLSVNQSYFIASVTKLFTSAVIFRLEYEKKICLDDKISKYLGSSIINRIHIFNGQDFSNEISIKHLLAHTSGLPDYFQDGEKKDNSLKDEIINGKDRSWTFEQVVERTKMFKPLFAPDSKNKAHYSDTNFQLLGKIIESVTGKSYSENCEEFIINPLGLSKTYLYQNFSDKTPKTLYYKSNELKIPKSMTSFGADGGIVSNSSELLMFVKGFFTGLLFPVEYINKIQIWNKIFFPLQSGIGIHKFQLPWIFNPANKIPYFIGHSGLSGALAFYSPKENIFISGTTNQAAYPDLSFKTMIKLTEILIRNKQVK